MMTTIFLSTATNRQLYMHPLDFRFMNFFIEQKYAENWIMYEFGKI